MLSQDVPADDAWLVRVALPEKGGELAASGADPGGAWPGIVQVAEGVAS
jgi:hypothetical protein